VPGVAVALSPPPENIPQVVVVQASPVLESAVNVAVTVSGAESLVTVMAIFTALPPAKSGEGRVMLMTGGPGTTISIAAVVVAFPTAFVKTAWYW